MIIVGLLISIPAFGIGDIPIHQNRTIGFGFGAWCFFFTAFACVMGIFPLDVEVFSSGWNFQFAMNILTPLILIGSGLLLPRLANKDK